MALKPLRILAVGQLKSPHYKQAAAHYVERLRHWRDVRETLVKDGDPALPTPQRNAVEGQRLCAALTPQDCVVCLDEKGKPFTSQAFAQFVAQLSENAARVPCFIIGGAFGLDDAVRRVAHYTLALGPMTLPHELARVVLLEQLYRAETIVRRVPYHH